MGSFYIDLDLLQPSQLFINKYKLDKVYSLISKDLTNYDPIPIKNLDNDIIMTDGHTRALTLYKLGQSKIRVVWETEELLWIEYRVCVKWCKDNAITHIKDLDNRILDNDEYQIKWLDRCEKSRIQLGLVP